MLPKINRAQILAAIQQFDTQLRGSAACADWRDNQAHKWAIEHGGQHYPIKQIVALAAGLGVHTFSGGDALNQRVARLGFTVVRLESGAEAQPPAAPAAEMLATENQALRDCLWELELRVIAEQVRTRLALAALVANAELAQHVEDCPVSPCVCGYEQAEVLAPRQAPALLARCPPWLSSSRRSVAYAHNQSMISPNKRPTHRLLTDKR